MKTYYVEYKPRYFRRERKTALKLVAGTPDEAIRIAKEFMETRQDNFYQVLGIIAVEDLENGGSNHESSLV